MTDTEIRALIAEEMDDLKAQFSQMVRSMDAFAERLGIAPVSPEEARATLLAAPAEAEPGRLIHVQFPQAAS